MARSYTLAGRSGIAHVDRVERDGKPCFELRLQNGDVRQWPADAEGDRAALKCAISIAFGKRRT